jgi:hypothetical protein
MGVLDEHARSAGIQKARRYGWETGGQAVLAPPETK